MLNLLVKPGWVLLENVVQDRLGHPAFGLIAACSALAVVVGTLADLGLTQFTVQRLAIEPSFADSQFPTLLPMRGLLTLASGLALLALGWALGYRAGQLGLLAAVGAGLLLTQYGQFFACPGAGPAAFQHRCRALGARKAAGPGPGSGPATGR